MLIVVPHRFPGRKSNDQPTFLTVDLRIAKVSRRARALRLSVNHSALRVEAAHAVLQARIRADPVLAATLVGLAILVAMALQLVALLARLTLVALRAQAHRAMVRDAAERVYSAG